MRQDVTKPLSLGPISSKNCKKASHGPISQVMCGPCSKLASIATLGTRSAEMSEPTSRWQPLPSRRSSTTNGYYVPPSPSSPVSRRNSPTYSTPARPKTWSTRRMSFADGPSSVSRYDRSPESAGGSPPDVDVLPEIREVVGNLSAIEDEVRQNCAPILFDHLMSRVNGFLDDLEQDHDFSWLSAPERAKLSALWQDTKDSLSLDQVREELDRLSEHVPPAIEKIHQLARQLSQADAQRHSLSSEASADLAALHSLEENIEDLEKVILASRREQRHARIHLLSHLSPFGTDFVLDSAKPTSPPTPDGSVDSAEPVPVSSSPSEKREPATSPTDSSQVAIEPKPHRAPDDEPQPTVEEHPRPTSTPDEATSDFNSASTLPSEDASDKNAPPEHATSPPSPSPVPVATKELPRQRKISPTATRASDRMAAALLEPSPRLAYAVQLRPPNLRPVASTGRSSVTSP